VRALVLGSRFGKRPESLFEVDFVPSHADDFAAALTGQKQQPDDRAIGPTERVRRLPDQAQFTVVKHAITLGDRRCADVTDLEIGRLN
jgi:hypothetical protein